jgi:hypothetical protein
MRRKKWALLALGRPDGRLAACFPRIASRRAICCFRHGLFYTAFYFFLININQVKSSIKCPKVVFCKKKNQDFVPPHA